MDTVDESVDTSYGDDALGAEESVPPGDLTPLFGDLDGDGRVDVTAIDSDGDGVLDLQWNDANADGVVTADEIHPITDGGWSTDWYRHHENFQDGALPEDASASRHDDMHGDPAQASSYWYPQSINGYCVPASIAQVVGEWQGHNVGEGEVVARAVSHGWLTTTDTNHDGHPDDASGMTSDDAQSLLSSYGIPCHTEHGSLKALEGLLDQRRDIIAYVDADEIWYGQDDDASDGGTDSNHAVVVTGIDDENVYLADPGTPDGAVEVVPRAVFEDAWQDSDHEMLVTDTAPPETAPADNAPEHQLPPETSTPPPGTPPTPSPLDDSGGGGGAHTAPASAGGALISEDSSGVVFLPIVLRDVAIATPAVSAALLAAGIVRRRRARV